MNNILFNRSHKANKNNKTPNFVALRLNNLFEHRLFVCFDFLIDHSKKKRKLSK